MTLLLGVLLWFCGILFVLALCKAAKNGDRGLRRGMAVADPPSRAAAPVSARR